jgi:hypothetical protein
LSFLADDNDCQTEGNTFTNAGVEEAANFPGTYYGRIHQEGSNRNDASSFSTISLQGTVVAGFLSLRENHQLHRRHTEEIQRRNTPNRNKNTSATILVMSVPLQNTHKSDTDGNQSVHE